MRCLGSGLERTRRRGCLEFLEMSSVGKTKSKLMGRESGGE